MERKRKLSSWSNMLCRKDVGIGLYFQYLFNKGALSRDFLVHTCYEDIEYHISRVSRETVSSFTPRHDFHCLKVWSQEPKFLFGTSVLAILGLSSDPLRPSELRNIHERSWQRHFRLKKETRDHWIFHQRSSWVWMGGSSKWMDDTNGQGDRIFVAKTRNKWENFSFPRKD